MDSAPLTRTVDQFSGETIQDRIAAVIKAHERTGKPLGCVCGGRAAYRCVCDGLEECECGEVTQWADYPDHLAEVVASELGFTERA